MKPGVSKLLDEASYRLIMSLFEIDPHNEKILVRKTGLAVNELRRKFRELKRRGYLRVYAVVSHRRLGLRRFHVFLEASYVRFDLMSKILTKPIYWRTMARCYGDFNGYYCLYLCPNDQVSLLESLLKKLVEYGIIRRYKLIEMLDSWFCKPSLEYYDFSRGKWKLSLRDWIAAIDAEESQMPFMLRETPPREEFDIVDLYMLEELEADGAKPIFELARSMGISASKAYYHYSNHLIGRKLILQYKPIVYTFNVNVSYYIIVFMKAKSRAILAKILNSLRGRPFVKALSRSPSGNWCAVLMYIPRHALISLYRVLSKLVYEGYVSEYAMGILDNRARLTQSLEYPKLYLEDIGAWKPVVWYDEELMEKVAEQVSRVRSLEQSFSSASIYYQP